MALVIGAQVTDGDASLAIRNDPVTETTMMGNMPVGLRRVLPIVAVLCWFALIVGVVAAANSGDVVYGAFLLAPGYGTVGALLGMRRPHHPFGWLLIAMAAAPLLAVVVRLPIETQNGLSVAGLALILVLFPTGSPPSRVWFIPMVLVALSWIFVYQLGDMTFGSGLELPIGLVVAVLSLIACAAAPLVRFRRAIGTERAQLRWLGVAAATTAFAVVVMGVGLATGADELAELASGVVLIGLVLGLPVAILVAILRYRLYVLDRFVSRTVTYAVVAALVSAIYVVPVLLAPRVLGSSSSAVTASATLGAAVAFSPLRRRVRTLVDRRFNRSAYDAAREAGSFAANVRDEVELRVITEELTGAISRALQPQTVSVWLRSDQ